MEIDVVLDMLQIISYTYSYLIKQKEFKIGLNYHL